MITNVKAKCRNCNREASADQFKLHYQLKMMVCPDCYSGRTAQQQKQQKEAATVPTKPAGWDAEDDYLERASRMKKDDNQAQFSRIPGSDHVKCKCSSCKFSFRYSPVNNMPNACPYCNLPVPRLKTFNLL